VNLDRVPRHHAAVRAGTDLLVQSGQLRLAQVTGVDVRACEGIEDVPFTASQALSHELRTPLTIIKGEADIALRGDDKSRDVYQDALRRVSEAADHTARLVDGLLFVARTEAGEIRLELQRVQLHTVVEEARDIFSHEVSVEGGGGDGTVRCDPGRIRQALLVLLENARHHGRDRIHVRTGTDVAGLTVSVEDSGPGMNDADKALAFERFFRGSNAAERYRKGTGLGLPVALSSPSGACSKGRSIPWSGP